MDRICRNCERPFKEIWSRAKTPGYCSRGCEEKMLSSLGFSKFLRKQRGCNTPEDIAQILKTAQEYDAVLIAEEKESNKIKKNGHEIKAEQREKDQATGIKAKFVARILGLLKEYIQESEHQEGLQYWLDFNGNEAEMIHDFAVFIEELKDV